MGVDSSAAKCLGTWWHNQVYLPCVGSVLHLTKIGLRVSGALHRKLAGSAPSQRCIFAGEGRTAQVAQPISQSSRLSTLYHLIQLVSQLWNIWLLPPVMELPLVRHLLGVALCQVGVFVLKPTPPLPCWTLPTTSLLVDSTSFLFQD